MDDPTQPQTRVLPLFERIAEVAQAAQMEAEINIWATADASAVAQSVARLEPTTDMRAIARAARFDYDGATSEGERLGFRLVVGVANALLDR